MSTSFAGRGRSYWHMRRAYVVYVALLASLGCTGVTPNDGHRARVQRVEPNPIPTAATRGLGETETRDLALALRAVANGRYPVAEKALLRLTSQPSAVSDRAAIALAEVELMTGRREQALSHALAHCNQADGLAAEACTVAAEALRRQGQLERATTLLTPYAAGSDQRRVRLALADLLLDRGRVTEARVLYRRLVDDFAESRIATEDASEFAVTGRAAHRLGAWRDANEFFNRAEMTGITDLTTLLWRGELYLDAHDPDHARAVADEALRFAPDHPSALLFYARVRLAAARDGEQAEEHVERALAIDATRADGYAILAGLALRDLDFDRFQSHLERGLKQEPTNLELLSLRAVASFLADNQRGFDAAVFDVLRQNPSHARVYRMVAEYAEAEHRYDDTIPLLRRALELDPDDSVVRAQLGIQLLRSGEETEGRKQLSRAFAKDPFDLRVRNTLVLYEQKIDKEYTTVRHGRFTLRLPTAYREVLDAIVPTWLEQANTDLQKRYGRLNPRGVVVELYADQDSFGVRTSGVPSTYLQGVCFGTTIVARLPTDEPTNLGMTLWHELSHVYHLRLSRHRVPRWFTEGLAEVETARHRSEWSREQELAVYEALQRGRLPHVKQMNRAFSHAASLDDLGVAYVASTYLVEYLVRSYGFDRITKMLRAYGQGKSTDQIASQILGTDLDLIDQAFREALRQRFARFETQYIPPRFAGNLERARADFSAQPNDPTRRAALAHAELLRGRAKAAREIIAQAPAGTPQQADLLWVSSMVELADQQTSLAEASLRKMIANGNDGYFVRMQLALVARQSGDVAGEREALLRAHDYFERASEPLYRLATIARESHDAAGELSFLSRLSELEEADLKVHRRRVELSLDLGKFDLARASADALAFVDPLDVDTHRLLARVAVAVRDRSRALRELGFARALATAGTERDEINALIARVAAGGELNPRHPN